MQRSPAKGSPRRVLGDLSPNKHLASPQKSKTRVGQDPKVPYPSAKSSQNFMPAALLPPRANPTTTAKKRSFDAVEKSGADNDLKRRHVPQSPLRQSHTFSSTMSDSNTIPPQERDSDETDDEIIIPRPQITASQETIPMPSQSQNDNSFSSLIDYGDADASDKSMNASTSPNMIHSADVSFSAAPPSRAETLRLRLQMAMYRVSTDQVHIPMSDLQVPDAHETLSRRIKHVTSQEKLRAASRQNTPKTKQTSFTQQQSQSAPKLLPAPTLQPSNAAPTSHKIAYEVASGSPGQGRGFMTTPTGSKRFHEMFVVSDGVGLPR